MNEFINTFSKYSNSELLKILRNFEDYQPLAVEAAKVNLDSRNLSDEEINILNQEIEAENDEFERLKPKNAVYVRKSLEVLNTVTDTINPIQKTPLTIDKTIRTFCYVFGIVSFIFVYDELGLIRFMFTSSPAKWDFSMIFYFLPVILVPIATISFYLRKKIGWILFAVFLTFSSISAIYSFIIALKMRLSGNSMPFSLVPTTISIGTVFFYIGSMWVISKPNIRQAYSISTKTMFTITGTISTIFLIYVFVLFKY